ncbi:MAG TPA: PilZ domain-containing protein [Rhodanobacteraceae bacterium]|nr:PilZ domain-containing protein [Rhodanobacteraceae bacterium]
MTASNVSSTDKMRHARMRIDSAAFMSHGHEAWSCQLADISATGVRVCRPNGWHGGVGDRVTLDMLVGDTLNIHLEAHVARVTNDYIAFSYSRIPEDKEVPLWNLLGGYADTLEPWDEEHA